MPSPPRWLIVNADDFGLSPGVNRGIWEAFEAGSVTSVSLMANAPGWDDAIQRLQSHRNIPSVGLHLTFTAGRPLTNAPSLVDRKTGAFLSLPRFLARALRGGINASEVAAECEAQFDRVTGQGLMVSHVDSHHHVHVLSSLWSPVAALAARAGVPHLRVPVEPVIWKHATARSVVRDIALRVCMRRVVGQAVRRSVPYVRGMALHGSPHFLDDLLSLVDALPVGITELIVHPGYADAPLRAWDRYTDAREIELRALTSMTFLNRLRTNSIQLESFAESAAATPAPSIAHLPMLSSDRVQSHAHQQIPNDHTTLM